MTPDTENMQNVRKQHNNEGSQAATSCDSNKDNINNTTNKDTR